MELECRTVVDRGSEGRGTEGRNGGRKQVVVADGHTGRQSTPVTSRPETRLVQRSSSRMLCPERVSPQSFSKDETQKDLGENVLKKLMW